MALDPTATEFRELGLRLKAADKSLMPIVRKDIRVATAPAADAVRASALATLPKGGGANQFVASQPIRTSILLGAKTAGVKLTVGKKSYTRIINAGILRHPVFGRRDNPQDWQNTTVQPGYASRPLDAFAPVVEVACMAAMRETAAIAGFE